MITIQEKMDFIRSQNTAYDEGMMNILKEADNLTAGDRRKDYGDPGKNFNDVSKIWTVILGHTVTPQQVIDCMIALKLCRAKQGYKRDTYVDIAGYARCAEMLWEAEHAEDD